MAAYRNGFRKEQLHNAYPCVAELSFDSDRKLMTTVNRMGEAATGLLAGGQTMAFMVLALSQTIHAFHLRSDRSVFKIGLFGNHKLSWAVFASLVLFCLVLFTPLRMAFGLIALPVALYLKGFLLVLVPTAVMEAVKGAAAFLRHKS